MKVLFQASILHRNERMEDYVAIVQCLEKCGCEVLGETLVVSNDLILKRGHVDRVKYFERFKKNLLEADLVCFEATYPSTLHVGINLAFALQKGKKHLTLNHLWTFLNLVSCFMKNILLTIWIQLLNLVWSLSKKTLMLGLTFIYLANRWTTLIE